MNKRKIKKASLWWIELNLHEKDDLIELFVPKKKQAKSWNYKPTDSELENMFNYTH